MLIELKHRGYRVHICTFISINRIEAHRDLENMRLLVSALEQCRGYYINSCHNPEPCYFFQTYE